MIFLTGCASFLVALLMAILTFEKIGIGFVLLGLILILSSICIRIARFMP